MRSILQYLWIDGDELLMNCLDVEINISNVLSIKNSGGSPQRLWLFKHRQAQRVSWSEMSVQERLMVLSVTSPKRLDKYCGYSPLGKVHWSLCPCYPGDLFSNRITLRQKGPPTCELDGESGGGAAAVAQ